MMPGRRGIVHHYHHRFAPAGIEYPRVRKSACFSSIPFIEENKLFKLLFLAIFRRLFFSCSSARTFAVSEAVSGFWIVPSSIITVLGECEMADFGFLSSTSRVVAPTLTGSFFLFFPVPGAFLSECARHCSFSFCARSLRCCLSADDVGRIVITLSLE